MATEPLNQAAAARHQRAVQHAKRALRELDAEDAAISFQSVARRGGVSRQWLYTQPELREAIEARRDGATARTNPIPARQRATEASLRQRVESLRAENQRLRDENRDLKAELAIVYGQLRAGQAVCDAAFQSGGLWASRRPCFRVARASCEGSRPVRPGPRAAQARAAARASST